MSSLSAKCCLLHPEASSMALLRPAGPSHWEAISGGYRGRWRRRDAVGRAARERQTWGEGGAPPFEHGPTTTFPTGNRMALRCKSDTCVRWGPIALPVRPSAISAMDGAVPGMTGRWSPGATGATAPQQYYDTPDARDARTPTPGGAQRSTGQAPADCIEHRGPV